MDKTILLMIIGMGLVTYLPRMIPLVALGQLKLPVFVQNVLKNVPYATLGALIVPGIFLISDDIVFGLVGAAAATLIAFTGANVIVVVMGSIGTLVLYSMFFS
ncbi:MULTISPECIES: AzlD domain-containing protein [Bacillaceae]|uniref:AzlD domain-containing protein n=1 Tax=Metabacillus endolithicus TaxID=1535204 RepID=A0ABW5C3L4_9BACI|nr:MULTISPECIES: AzlD domain-containing protein [Bacillaceae]MCM3411271.1 AzlD domain-containing protein [Metabacillus litoralis]PGT91401.1 branched-chain amino acid transporter [Bacillus sp. AFS040349]UGB31659.1 AzlD domain-containing protein [Metabacillus sp. B2-18]UHA60338.1 AzlD domain-containing protein [Metabacillus litoralis]UPG62320.1 AzlD domain-containing protein [Metabacillus endolithicus]